MTDNSFDEPLNIQIDKRLSSYASWFSFEWGQQLFKDVAIAPKLFRYCQRLHFNWLVTARTCFLPWLVVDSVRGTTAGMNTNNGYQEQVAMLTEALKIRLMQNLSQPLNVRQEICQELSVAASQLERLQIPENAGEISPLEIWNDFLKHRAFALGVWGSQVQGYSQVFFHYEHFLTRCIEGMESSLPDREKTKGLHLAANFTKAFEKHFGQPAAQEFVTDIKVDEARLARHALAHNGGLLTGKLKGITHSFDVDPASGQILIMPLDVANLYHYLKDKVSSLCSMLVTKAELQ